MLAVSDYTDTRATNEIAYKCGTQNTALQRTPGRMVISPVMGYAELIAGTTLHAGPTRE